MIPRSADWKNALAMAVRDPAELLALLELPESLLEEARMAARDFPLRVPRGFISRMQKGNLDDPLLRQVLPLGEELRTVPGFDTDPVGDLAAQAGSGLLHKYHGRILLSATGACAVHCRYCFRRHFPYREQHPARDNWQGVVDYLQTHPEVDELILSGGDPLMLDTGQLHALGRRLREILHLRRLRLHTRLPIVLPERIDHELLEWFSQLPWPVIMVIHCNHAREIDTRVANALAHLHQRGVILLNQSVLLAGVNDSVESLTALSHALFRHRVTPYYLHVLDRVAGAAHFDLPHAQALGLITALRARLPGYLVPRLVRERAGESAKSPLT